MKIAILGTRGIPNNHGGFEQFAEYLSKHLADKGHQIYVYNSHTHPYQNTLWNQVNIIHCKDPEDRIGTAGQFIYDLNCILDSRKRNFDVILQLGYTSSSIWGWLLPKTAVIITNMDGLEWKRSKYSKPVRGFLKVAERLAIKFSDFLISDSLGIQEYLEKKYARNSKFIAYGANTFNTPSDKILVKYKVQKYQYNMLVARLEPENNIMTILDGIVLSRTKTPFLVIGKHMTKYGEFLKDRYKATKNIVFVGGVYNLEDLNNLRYHSNLYFHGHSVGGTNPSLLEAMASNALIVANDNVFNKSILGNDTFYFNTFEDVANKMSIKKSENQEKINNNLAKINEHYNWEYINTQYEQFVISCTEDRI